ncbi:hypothetical protein EDC01DRAFT_635201 [Geopyxis carbonaria]|nr:hypothetical protein EDC01DRAFT_635201 [Geopyxis carbonaria]
MDSSLLMPFVPLVPEASLPLSLGPSMTLGKIYYDTASTTPVITTSAVATPFEILSSATLELFPPTSSVVFIPSATFGETLPTTLSTETRTRLSPSSSPSSKSAFSTFNPQANASVTSTTLSTKRPFNNSSTTLSTRTKAPKTSSTLPLSTAVKTTPDLNPDKMPSNGNGKGNLAMTVSMSAIALLLLIPLGVMIWWAVWILKRMAAQKEQRKRDRDTQNFNRLHEEATEAVRRDQARETRDYLGPRESINVPAPGEL